MSVVAGSYNGFLRQNDLDSESRARPKALRRTLSLHPG
jgi:hypothetical protein